MLLFAAKDVDVAVVVAVDYNDDPAMLWKNRTSVPPLPPFILFLYFLFLLSLTPW